MEPTKEQIISEYKKLKIKPGRIPRSREFYKIISEHTCVKVFGRNPYSKIQQAAGDKPRQFKKPRRSIDEFF